MILGLIAMLVANAATVVAARAALDRIRTNRPHVDALLFVLLRLILISAIVLVAGLAWLIRPIGLLGLSLVPLIWLRPTTPLTLPPIRAPRGAGEWLLVTACTLVIVKLLLQAWFFVPYSADALSYHLPKIAEWVRAGHFTRQLGVDTHAAFPAGFELVETWWVAFLHHDVIIEAAGIEFLILAFVAAFALAKELKLSDHWAVFAALAFAMMPGLNLQATSELNDLPMTALVVSTAALLMADTPVPLVLLPIGLGIGIKGTFLFALPGLAWIWISGRLPKIKRHARMTAVTFAIIAIAAGGFWYARNAVWFGNPLHPMTTSGVTETSGYVTIRFGVSAAGAYENFSELIETRLGDREAAYSALSRRVSGWGALAYACGLPAMLVILRRDARFRRLALGLAISLVSTLLLVQHDDWFARFVLFFAVAPMLATAMLASGDRRILILAVPALLLQFASTMVPEELQRFRVEGLARQPWSSRTLAPLFDVRMEGAGDAIGYYADNVGEAYWCYGPDYARRVVYLRATTPEALVEEMKQGGVKLFYAVPGTVARQQVLNDAVRSGALVFVSKQIYSLAR